MGREKRIVSTAHRSSVSQQVVYVEYKVRKLGEREKDARIASFVLQNPKNQTEHSEEKGLAQHAAPASVCNSESLLSVV